MAKFQEHIAIGFERITEVNHITHFELYNMNPQQHREIDVIWQIFNNILPGFERVTEVNLIKHFELKT